MKLRPMTGTPSQLIVEQLAASGVKYLFYNSGSREAPFFDALHMHAGIHGILGLHEGSVTAMAGGYAQVKLDPAVMVVHLGAGLAQSLGQLINVWSQGLPVVVLTFAGDTGSYSDKVGLDLSHNFGPTSISAPFTKANWTVIEPDGLPHVLYRALQVARTPPAGPVHVAVYDRLLNYQQVSSSIIEDELPDLRAGYPAEAEVEHLARALAGAERPVFYVGDGVWKSGAEHLVMSLAERLGVPIVAGWGEIRIIPVKHPLNCGRLDLVGPTLRPDQVICIGANQGLRGNPLSFKALANVQQFIAIGSDVAGLKNYPGLDLAILADERRTLERLEALLQQDSLFEQFEARRAWAQTQAAAIRKRRLEAARQVEAQPQKVRPWVLEQALDRALEQRGGGLIAVEQYALSFDGLLDSPDIGHNRYLRAAGPSEGYGVGGAIGVKLAAPSRPVVGLVGDGSFFYADSGVWTAVHHGIPLLYIISNNQAYGIVAGAFDQGARLMHETGEYAGVALEGIDPVKIAAGFGLEGRHIQDEACLDQAIEDGLNLVETEQRPFLLNVHLPLGLPPGGRPAVPYRLTEM
jgi:benzoylformate decarboxylase